MTSISGVLRQLEATQWYTAAALSGLQHRQLGALGEHLNAHSTHFRARLHAAGLEARDLIAPGGLQKLPVLSRRTLQASADIFCDSLPPGHAPTYDNRTSGSTGEPVLVRRTAVNGLDWAAVTLREHLWHRGNARLRLCTIRAHVERLEVVDTWGPPVNWVFDTGPLLRIPITTEIDRQIELILEFKPDILVVYPSSLAALLSRGIAFPSVQQVLTVGETLSPEMRDAARSLWNATIVDNYSSQELGTIAIQCPMSDGYHVMAEHLLIEVLNGDGTACAEGETGRVVATDFRNFATPLVRYDIGDFAQVGGRCRCGRGLPTLQRIFGRERNLVLMPDGARRWPYLGGMNFSELAPVLQFQFVQDGRETIELRLVTKGPLNSGNESQLAARVQKVLGFPFQLRFTYFEERIPAGANGKFEEFLCRV